MVPFVLAVESCAISNNSFVVSSETEEETGFNAASESFFSASDQCVVLLRLQLVTCLTAYLQLLERNSAKLASACFCLCLVGFFVCFFFFFIFTTIRETNANCYFPFPC